MSETTSSPQLAITMCIATANRPDTLARGLEAMSKMVMQPARIIVSDDSPDGAETQAVCEKYGVEYVRGPRRGLCANRNSMIRRVTTSHLSLIDDDAIVSPHFIADAMPLLRPLEEKEIITGDVRDAGVLVDLRNGSFWGYFSKPAVDRRETIHLNCNIFPRNAFDVAEFDESIIYGYEDMDMCTQMLMHGFHIKHYPHLLNDHLRPVPMTAKRIRQMHQARFYISLKRYLFWEPNLGKALLYIILAPLQRAFHSIKSGDWTDVRSCVPDMVTAIRDIMAERRRMRELSPPGGRQAVSA